MLGQHVERSPCFASRRAAAAITQWYTRFNVSRIGCLPRCGGLDQLQRMGGDDRYATGRPRLMAAAARALQDAGDALG